MPRGKDVKRVVRKRMTETGERYTDARAAVRPDAPRRRSRPGQPPADSAEGALIEVEIPVGIRLHLNTGQHFVVLKERGGDRWLSFAIGMSEANAIAVVLTGMTVQRPLTPDLIVSSIRALGGDVARVVVTRVEKGTFFAEVQVHGGDGRLAAIDARPSDALGVAVRTGAPIFVSADVMAVAGVGPESLPVGATADEMRLLREGGSPIRTASYAPIIPPTHMLVDNATEHMVTLLNFPQGEPNVGTDLRLRATAGWRIYRIVGVEPAIDGLIRLRGELVETGESIAGGQSPISP